MVEFKLPEDFLFGTATASAQIEGGDTNNTWYKWCEEGNIKDASNCIIANDHWNRVEEDTQILTSLNVQVHRMSLEWSRIEPSKGTFSEEALSHYRHEIELLRANGIKPLVTLHHFSEPIWFQKIDGWLNPESIKLFLNYVTYVIEKLGDIVSEWVTFNEPNVYTILGYAVGIWPPGKINPFTALKVQAQIIKAHVEAYKLIHEIRAAMNTQENTMVGCALHLRIFDSTNFIGRKIALAVNYIFNELTIEGMTTGKLKFPLSKKGQKHKKGIYADFLGINYYTRNIVKFEFNPANWFFKTLNDDSLDQTDLGWDIYPQGIYRVCKKYYSRYKLPIFITENGIADKHDTKRIDFICNHLINVIRALNEGIPVKRYYYWTLIDNFEWQEGETAHFGLLSCNFQNQERILRNSGEFYADLCKYKKMTKEMLQKYFPSNNPTVVAQKV